MQTVYKYHFGRRTIYWTLFHLVVFVLLGWLLYHSTRGATSRRGSRRSSWRSWR